MTCIRNGIWNIEVQRDGEYQFSLRRWPVEADAGLAAALPPVQVTDGEYPAGKSLPITRARLSVAGFDEARPVGSEDRAAIDRCVQPRGRRPRGRVSGGLRSHRSRITAAPGPRWS